MTRSPSGFAIPVLVLLVAFIPKVSSQETRAGISGTPGEAELRTRIEGDQREFSSGTPFHFLIEVSILREDVDLIAEKAPDIRVSSNLRVDRVSQGIRSSDRPEGVTRVLYFRYTLTGSEPGPAQIRDTEVSFRFSREGPRHILRTPPVDIVIVPHSNRKWVVALAVLLIVGGAGATLAQRILSRRSPPPVPRPVTGDLWIRELQERERLRIEGNVKAYLGEIRRILSAAVLKRVCGDESVPHDELERRLREGALGADLGFEYLDLIQELKTLQFAPEEPSSQYVDRMAQKTRDLIAAVWKQREAIG